MMHGIDDMTSRLQQTCMKCDPFYLYVMMGQLIL